MRVVGAMRSVFTEDDLVEAASVIGRAMAEVSAASVELFRRRVTTAFVDAGLGELEIALRLAAMSELLIPPLEPMLETALRHHLQAAVQTEAALPLEASAAPASEQELTVAFADLVGFTQISEQVSPLELGKVVARLLRRAEPEREASQAQGNRWRYPDVQRAPDMSARAVALLVATLVFLTPLGLGGAAVARAASPATFTAGAAVESYTPYCGPDGTPAANHCQQAP